MRIVFDGAPLAGGPVTGVARAFLTSLAAYCAMATDAVAVLLPKGADSTELPWGIELVPAPTGALRRQGAMPRLLRQLGARVLHSPVAAVPLRAPCPTIATVHDLPWCSPLAVEASGLWRPFATRWSVRRSSAVLVPSMFTFRCLVDWAGKHLAGKARVVPHGIPQPDSPAPESALTGPFLVLGDDRQRKNRDRIAAAHASARAQCPTLPDLRFVGPPDAYVSEREKVAILRQSRALVHGSLLEGFGLPVLEAMAHGVPVVCSAAASLPEVAGNAALFFDPLDKASIADALVTVHENELLRGHLRTEGLLRAMEFPPERTAKAWLALHRELSA